MSKIRGTFHSGLSGRQVNEYLTDEGFRTKSGKRLTLSMTYRILKEPFYYGEFEYPKGSGAWYTGSHTSLITKEDFEQAQKQIKTVEKGKWGRKNFYFSRLLKCGHCGSGISGEERVNRHGKHYIYYKCNKYGGRKICKSKYISENNLVDALTKIIDQIKNQHEHLERRLKHEVEKFNNLQKILNKGKEIQKLSTSDYIEYIFKNGNNQEKGNILQYIQGQLYLEDGEIKLR